MIPATPLSPALFLAGAHVMLGLPRPFPGRLGTIGLPWAAAFVHTVGYWSHYDSRAGVSCWPLPPTADCNELWEAAQSAHVGSRYAPDPGEIFLVWSADEGRYVHAGIVVTVLGTGRARSPRRSYVVCKTIEGNVTPRGALGGPGIHVVERRLVPDFGDRFIRWVDLDRRGSPALATYHEICQGRMLRGRAA